MEGVVGEPLTAVALASFVMIAFATPSLSMERIGKPSSTGTLVTRVADLDRPAARSYRTHRHARVYGQYRDAWYWERRAYANRWLNFHYVNAGYPVRHYHPDVYYTYLPPHCCYGVSHRHW
jgi:hypothetical protein